MKAIILSAGFSVRMSPLTDSVPKGLLPLGGKELAAYVADDIVQTKAITEIVLVSNSRFADLFRQWTMKRYNGKIRVMDNGINSLEKRLGGVSDLIAALDNTGWDEDILVTASDTISSLRMNDFISFYNKHRGVSTVIYRTKDPAQIAGKLSSVRMRGERMVEFVEKPAVPPTLIIGIPFYIFPRASLPLIRKYREEGNNLEGPGYIIKWLIDREPVYACETRGYYYDVGTPATYYALQTSLATGTIPPHL